jgi:hypothetical protein
LNKRDFLPKRFESGSPFGESLPRKKTSYSGNFLAFSLGWMGSQQLVPLFVLPNKRVKFGYLVFEQKRFFAKTL